jgi:hypothetical protein
MLPVELIHEIVRLLPLEDLITTRLCSHQLLGMADSVVIEEHEWSMVRKHNHSCGPISPFDERVILACGKPKLLSRAFGNPPLKWHPFSYDIRNIRKLVIPVQLRFPDNTTEWCHLRKARTWRFPKLKEFSIIFKLTRSNDYPWRTKSDIDRTIVSYLELLLELRCFWQTGANVQIRIQTERDGLNGYEFDSSRLNHYRDLFLDRAKGKGIYNRKLKTSTNALESKPRRKRVRQTR